MAAVLSYFEVRLSDDVLRDIKSEGKVCKVDLMDIQESHENQAGADYTKTALSATVNRQKSPTPRIQLEKLDDTFIRLLITVYKSSIENETVESEVQTMTAESDHTSTQTDSSEWMQSVDTQANSCEWSLVSGTQTDQSEWLHSEATQIDAGFASDDGITQTDWQGWLHSANLQTDSSYWQSSVSAQTEVKQISSSAAQTTEMRVGQTFADVANETLSNLATQVNEQVQAVAVMSNVQSQISVDTAESHCQVTPSIADGTMQTEHHVRETSAQTELSLAWRAERETQAVVDVFESSVQASVAVDVIDCQTDSSMANLLSCDVQASVDVTSSDSQTDLVQSNSEAQTETSMSQQVSSEVQAVVSQTDSQTEHDLSHITDDVPSLPAAQDLAAVNESFDDFAAGNATLPHDTSFQQLLEHGPVQDSSSQTDPVTIIIGDASFLVKKLKNSAGSPSRVTTSGNEIEIELSADAVTEGGSGSEGQVAVPHTDEKENEMLMRQQGVMMQQPAVLRSGGVMVRGGGVSGPRFRMPVAQSPAAGVSPGLLVRHPAQQVVISPQQMVPGPQPVVGGSFSCPFCSLTFIDSPALYEHLSILHTVDQKTKWKQPRGREGKTIVPVKRSGRSPAGMASQSVLTELGPPVLTPVEAVDRSGGGDGPVDGHASQQSHADAQEAGLFEDPVEPEPEVTKKPRGRPPKRTAEEGATPTKRQKVMEEDDGDENDEVTLAPKSKQHGSGDAGADDKQASSTGGKRGGRTARGGRRKS